MKDCNEKTPSPETIDLERELKTALEGLELTVLKARVDTIEDVLRDLCDSILEYIRQTDEKIEKLRKAK